MAADAGATLLLVTVYRPLPEREQRRAADQLGDDAYKVMGSHSAEDVLSTARDHAVAAGATDITRLAIEGDAVDELATVAGEQAVDLVVIGNRGLNKLAGRLFGSVPANVSQRSSVDVLVVHTTGT